MAMVLVLVAAVPHVVNLWHTSALKNCLNAAPNATCDHELFELLAASEAAPSESSAEDAVTLVVALAWNEDETIPLSSEKTEMLQEFVRQSITESSAVCAIKESRRFALRSLDVDAGRSVAGLLDSIASLETPVRSTVLNGLIPDSVSVHFDVATYETTNIWLSSVPHICSS
jgi:hypothetical protein